MTAIVQFKPKSEIDSQRNLDDLIRLARDELTAFGDGGAWHEDRWQQGKTVVVFATKTQPLRTHHYTPLAEPFMQFAKAYVRYTYSHRPVVSVAPWLQALRCLEAALLHAHGEADIALVNRAVMDLSAEKCRDFYNVPESRHKTGLALAAVFKFCREHFLVAGCPSWKSPFPKPVILTEDIGEAGKQHRASKLPSNETMMQLAELFASATDDESRFFSSIAILLMATPSRISEVLLLPVDCVQWELDEDGNKQMYLQWHAAKGKGPLKKWVTPAMWDVVLEAVSRLTEIGQPARNAARFAFDNPGVFMRHAGCITESGHDEERALTKDQVWAAMGSAKGLRKGAESRNATYRTLSEQIARTYEGANWPFIDERSTVRYWEALCLHREFEFHKVWAPREFSWRLPTPTQVGDRFGAADRDSLFVRAGMTNPDGSRIKLTTHQPRHWLSTMSERAGMDDYTLAQWAGRADSTHNRHYDHRSPEEKLETARDLLGRDQPTVLEKFKDRMPVTFEELGIDRLGTAKVTLYGLCSHDYAMTPCMKQRECMTCKDHVCVKGDHITLDRIKLLEAQTERLLRLAEKAHEAGDFGANRWADNHRWSLAHTRVIRTLLESETVPEGALIRIPDSHDPSPVRRALLDLGLVDVPQGEATITPQALVTFVESDHA